MSTYVISSFTINDIEKYKKYGSLAVEAVKAYNGEFVVPGRKIESLEGSFDSERVTIIKFSDKEQAQKFYNSIEYQTARNERLGGVEFKMILVDGI